MRSDHHLGRVTAVIASIAIFLAPLLALLYSPIAGLAVMAIALSITAMLLREALNTAGMPRSRFSLLVRINFIAALACLFLLIVLIARV